MRRDAVLLVVDLQNDFLPGGALSVERGDEVIPVINRIAPRFENVLLTQDWHTPGHISFASSHAGQAPFSTIELDYGRQVLWPDHCIQGSHGAAFADAMGWFSASPGWAAGGSSRPGSGTTTANTSASPTLHAANDLSDIIIFSLARADVLLSPHQFLKTV